MPAWAALADISARNTWLSPVQRSRSACSNALARIASGMLAQLARTKLNRQRIRSWLQSGQASTDLASASSTAGVTFLDFEYSIQASAVQAWAREGSIVV